MHTAHTTDIAPDFAPDWAAIAVVILGVTAFAVGQGLTYPLIALILESRGVSSSMAGLNASVFALGLASSTLLIGRLTQVVRGDRLIVASLLGVSVCLATFSLFDSSGSGSSPASCSASAPASSTRSPKPG